MKQEWMKFLCKQIVALLLILFLGFSSLGNTIVFAEAAEDSITQETENTYPFLYTSDSISANFKQINSWEGGYQGEIAMTNVSSEKIEEWSLSFQTTDEIQNSWNCNMKVEGGFVTITPLEYNAAIEVAKPYFIT